MKPSAVFVRFGAPSLRVAFSTAGAFAALA
jgi:hypothetical protein